MAKPKDSNNFSDCLSMKLHSKPVRTSWFFQQIRGIFTSQPQEKIELQLTIRFGEQEIPILGGTVKFGLRGGELKLNLTNCKIPLENLEFTPVLSAIIEIEEQRENSKGTEKAAIFTPRGGVTAKRNKANKKSYKLKDEAYQVYTKGTEENPIWVFQIQTNKDIFIGGWQKEKIGILVVDHKPCSVEALFEVKDEDIKITSATGIWSKNLIRNKTVLLQRELLFQEIKPKLQTYISKAELLYE